MKRFIKDEKGFAIVEAVFVLPIVMLITIALYMLTIFLYGRVNLQSSVNRYVDLCCIEYSSASISMASDATNGELAQESLTEVRNPYRHIFMGQSSIQQKFQQLVEAQSNRFSAGSGELEAKMEIKNYILYKEVVGNVSKNFKVPINLSFVGLPNELKLTASAKRMISDQDELIRNLDIALDVTKYYDQKYGISDSIGEMFKKSTKLTDKAKGAK